MAEKLTESESKKKKASTKTPKAPRKPRKQKAEAETKALGSAEGNGVGHNLTEIREKIEPWMGRILAQFDELESVRGEIMADIKALYEEGAKATGAPRKIMRMVVETVRREKRIEAKLAELETSERDTLETLEAAFHGTPFGKYFGEQLGA